MTGALLLGGAATGTTIAAWHDRATLPSAALGSATMALTVDGSTAVSLGAVPELPANDGPTPGAARTITTTLRNDSSPGAKNMLMQLHLDQVTASDAALAGVLELAATAVAPGEPCPTPAGAFAPVAGHPGGPLTATPLAPGESRQLCLDLRVRGGTAPSALGGSGTLVLTLRGEQVRP